MYIYIYTYKQNHLYTNAFGLHTQTIKCKDILFHDIIVQMF